MSQLIPFTFDAHNVRVQIDEAGDPWWVVADVCEVLGLTSPSEAAKRVEDQYLRKTEVLARDGKYYDYWIVNEPGLYELIFRSNKPDAKRFRQWVFAEVLPQIRKTGKYEVPAQHDPLEQFPELRAIRELVLATAEARILAQEATRKAEIAEARAVRAETKADMALDVTTRFTLEEFVLINGLGRQFPASKFPQYTSWLKAFCLEWTQDIKKAPVLGKSWDNENAYPIQALAAWLRHEQRKPQQIHLVKES